MPYRPLTVIFNQDVVPFALAALNEEMRSSLDEQTETLHQSTSFEDVHYYFSSTLSPNSELAFDGQWFRVEGSEHELDVEIDIDLSCDNQALLDGVYLAASIAVKGDYTARKQIRMWFGHSEDLIGPDIGSTYRTIVHLGRHVAAELNDELARHDKLDAVRAQDGEAA